MNVPLRVQRRVEWHDTDAAGIAHFTAYFCYMEAAEHELLRALGLSVQMHDAGGQLSWPRVNVQCDFRGSLRFEDVVDIDVSLARLGEKSATYRFVLTLGGEPVASGTTTAVCCRMTAGGRAAAIAIPAEIAARLRTALVDAGGTERSPNDSPRSSD